MITVTVLILHMLGFPLLVSLGKEWLPPPVYILGSSTKSSQLVAGFTGSKDTARFKVCLARLELEAQSCKEKAELDFRLEVHRLEIEADEDARLRQRLIPNRGREGSLPSLLIRQKYNARSVFLLKIGLLIMPNT